MSGGWRPSPENPIYIPPAEGRSECDGLWADVSELGKYAGAPNALDSLKAASYLLWVMSGRRWGGICETTERYTCYDGLPCSTGMLPVMMDYSTAMNYMQRMVYGEAWGSLPWQRVLFLRNRPVLELTDITISGVPMDVDHFAVYDHSFIAPNSTGCVDTCFDPCRAVVTYRWGTKPPPIGKMAALELADQFVKAVECPSECKLPERITSVSRQGVSFQVFDPQDFMNEGRTGLYTVDIFLKTVNPDRAQKRARVFSPDLPQGRRVTSGGTGWYVR